MSTDGYAQLLQIVSSMPNDIDKSNCSFAIRYEWMSLEALKRNDFSQAIKLAEKGLSAIPHLPSAEPIKGLLHGIKALAFFMTGSYSESIEDGSLAIKFLESHSSFEDDLATALNTQGGSLLSIGKTKEGITAFERAISIWKSIPGSENKISECNDNLRVAKSRTRPWWKLWLF